MDQSLTKIVDEALAQMPEILGLDAPRAEVWAGDLISLAAEVTGSNDSAVRELVSRLNCSGAVGGAVAALAVGVLSPAARGEPPVDAPDGSPEWTAALGTSKCDGAWIFTNRRGESAVFRFVDSLDAGHTIAVDLIPGPPETVGEVMVGPPEMVDLADDPESDVEATAADSVALARRVTQSVESTDRPSDTLVMNGPLLAARLAGITGRSPAVPAAVEPAEVAELPPVDPDDDSWATGILLRALGLHRDAVADPPPAPLGEAIANAAQSLRRAADTDAPIAQWLAASRGPVDLDEPDLRVVTAALAAAVRPHFMAPLDHDAREAVAHLEWADWLGVVIGSVREGPGASSEPVHLVDQVNRCPEVASTIPKSDRPRVEWALAICTDHWGFLGLTESGRITELGAWMLPRMLLEAWAPNS